METKREIFTYWFTPQMATVTSPKSGAKNFYQVTPVTTKAQTLLSQAIIRKLDHKWGSWDLNQCPCGKPVPQEIGLTHSTTVLASSSRFKNKNRANGVFNTKYKSLKTALKLPS